MNFATLWGRGMAFVRKWALVAFAYVVRYFRQIAKVVAIMIVVFELGGIWNEVHKMRQEQVKNRLYAMPEEQRKEFLGTDVDLKRRMESTSFVDGDVSIDGDVKLDEPVDVNLDEPIRVKIDQ